MTLKTLYCKTLYCKTLYCKTLYCGLCILLVLACLYFIPNFTRIDVKFEGQIYAANDSEFLQTSETVAEGSIGYSCDGVVTIRGYLKQYLFQNTKFSGWITLKMQGEEEIGIKFKNNVYEFPISISNETVDMLALKSFNNQGNIIRSTNYGNIALSGLAGIYVDTSFENIFIFMRDRSTNHVNPHDEFFTNYSTKHENFTYENIARLVIDIRNHFLEHFISCQ